MPIFTGSLWPFNEIVVPNPPNVDVIKVNPPSTLKRNPGSFALNSASNALFYTTGSGNWFELSAGAGAVAQITGDSGTANPAVGIIKIAGTANQIATSAGTNVVTLSLPAAITAPGSLTTTTTLTATSGDITATNGNFVASTSGTGLSLNPVVISGASPQTANGRVFSVTFTGVSIASGATQAFDIANTSIVGASTLAIVDWYGATAGSALSKVSQVSSAGHLVITMTNGTSATMVTSTADITFTGIVLN